MAMTRSLIAVVAAATMLAMLTACSGSKSDPTLSPSSIATTSSAPTTAPTTTTPPSPSPRDKASAEALTVVPRYFAALDKVATDPTVALNSLYDVAMSPDVLTDLSTYGQHRALGYKQSGTTRVVTSRVTAVNLMNKPSAVPSVYPTVQIRACIDVSQVAVTDSNGKRVNPASRPNFFLENLTVSNLKYPSPSNWRISNVTNSGISSCNGQ